MSEAAIRLNDAVKINGTGMVGRIVSIDRREGETDFLVLWPSTPFRDEETTLECVSKLIRIEGFTWILPNDSAGGRS